MSLLVSTPAAGALLFLDGGDETASNRLEAARPNLSMALKKVEIIAASYAATVERRTQDGLRAAVAGERRKR